MFWHNPEVERKSPDKIKTYSIKPGSALDAPKTLHGVGRSFEDALEEHFSKQGTNNELVIEMFAIFQIYDRDGIVNIQSCQNKLLKNRHERVVAKFVEENAQHLRHLKGYF